METEFGDMNNLAISEGRNNIPIWDFIKSKIQLTVTGIIILYIPKKEKSDTINRNTPLKFRDVKIMHRRAKRNIETQCEVYHEIQYRVLAT